MKKIRPGIYSLMTSLSYLYVKIDSITFALVSRTVLFVKDVFILFLAFMLVLSLEALVCMMVCCKVHTSPGKVIFRIKKKIQSFSG